MKLMVRKILIVLFIFAILLLMVACAKDGYSNNIIKQNSENTNISSTQLKDTKESETLPKQPQLNIDKEFDPIIEQIKTSINDNIWYNGDYSWYKSLEQQSFPLEIFKSTRNNYLYVLVENGVKAANSHMYIAIEFWSGEKGYTNEITNYIIDADIEKVKAKIGEHGYKLFKKTEMSLGIATQPDYPKMTPEREKTIRSIEEAIDITIRDEQIFSKDVYKISVRNFRDNDYRTKAVIENKQGKIWIRDINLNSDGTAGGAKIHKDDGTQVFKYQVSQYRKVAILEKEIDTSK